MKIFTAAQIRACDAYTIQAAGMRSYDLMERAATRCANWIRDNLPKDALFVALCGTGNNGGDGLALARLLHQRGYGVKAFLLRFSNELSADCQENLQRLQNIDKELVGMVAPDTFITDIPRHIIFIDALLGTGLSRPVEGWVARFIQHINQLPNLKIAIDLPSGLPADTVPGPDAAIIRAGHTLSFQFYKRTFLHPETAVYAGKVHLLDIGLDPTFIHATATQYKTIEPDDIAALYRPRDPFAHKGVYGHVLLVCGSYGKMGAAVLSARAALRAGAGLVTVLAPGCGYQVLQASVPEAMCRTAGDHYLTEIEGWAGHNTIGIGPGIGQEPATATALTAFLEQCKSPVVLDADALNIIANHPELLGRLPMGSVLTPHPKEFTRLFGDTPNSMSQADQARIQAMKHNITIVLKGHHTAVITAAGECWYNLTGNPGMATAGSGDVLTGIITGLIAEGYAPDDAAMMGVYLHGLSGDIALADQSQESLVAGDLVHYLGRAFRSLQAE